MTHIDEYWIKSHALQIHIIEALEARWNKFKIKYASIYVRNEYDNGVNTSECARQRTRGELL